MFIRFLSLLNKEMFMIDFFPLKGYGEEVRLK
jgi:hypothetical protein